MIRRESIWAVAPVVVWAALAIPYVGVGTDDFEEYFTSVTTTALAVHAIAQGSWPFWSVDLGLGMPQPLRFHFITHPLAPLCGVTDCSVLLRSIASLHVLIGAIFVALLAARFSRSRLLTGAAAVTYCLSSSVIQPLFTDDWPITAINESALPVLLYALLALNDARERRMRILWACVLGGTAGFLLSISLPVFLLIILMIVALSLPQWQRIFPWLVAAAALTLLMGAAQLHHIYGEFARTPLSLHRTDHDDFALTAHAWSAFVRPLFPSSPDDRWWWRTVFFGPVFAVCAVWSALVLRNRETRPLRVGLALGLVGLLVPPSWLYNINTAQWTFRAELNVFGILLAVAAIDHWRATRAGARWTPVLVALQVCWIALAVYPTWSLVLAVYTGQAPRGRHRLQSPGVADRIVALYHRKPGRVIFGGEAYRELRLPLFNAVGLAPNQLPMLGVPTVSAVAFGITTDDLYPMRGALEGEIRGDSTAVQNGPLLDVLGVRYVIALADETVAPDLREVLRLPRDLRVYENVDAWPEAFFVDRLPTGPVPRLRHCAHGRFLCADFDKYPLRKRTDPLSITRLPDGLRLTFSPADYSRQIVVTQWYRPGWAVTDGRASVTNAVEQLVGLRVEPGERAVTLQFRPTLRAALFATGLATEGLIAVTVLVLAVRAGRARSRRQHLRARPRLDVGSCAGDPSTTN